MKARRTVAATDKIHLRFTCNNEPMGSTLNSRNSPELWFAVEGTAPLRQVTVVRNEKDWKQIPGDGSPNLVKDLTDKNPSREKTATTSGSSRKTATWPGPPRSG